DDHCGRCAAVGARGCGVADRFRDRQRHPGERLGAGPVASLPQPPVAASRGAESQIDFGIASAIRENDSAQALSQLAAALDGGVVPVMVLGQLRVAALCLSSPLSRSALVSLFLSLSAV